jgi:hypothetical protein
LVWVGVQVVSSASCQRLDRITNIAQITDFNCATSKLLVVTKISSQGLQLSSRETREPRECAVHIPARATQQGPVRMEQYFAQLFSRLIPGKSVMLVVNARPVIYLLRSWKSPKGQYRRAKSIRLIVDNYIIHKCKKTQK